MRHPPGVRLWFGSEMISGKGRETEYPQRQNGLDDRFCLGEQVDGYPIRFSISIV